MKHVYLESILDAKIGVDTAENESSKVSGFRMGVGGFIIIRTEKESRNESYQQADLFELRSKRL